MRSDQKTVFAVALGTFLVSCLYLPLTAGGLIVAWDAAGPEVDWAILAFRGLVMGGIAVLLCLWADDPSPAAAEERVQ